MTNEDLRQFSWYQTIEFEPGLTSSGCAWCGDPAWENIKKFLPEDLTGKRILDLGCNAGIFCVRSALMGAECVGVESDEWKRETNYLAQAEFVRSYFENKCSKKLNIRYIRGRIEEVINQDLGHFDYCLAIASIYYVNDPGAIVKRLTEICDNIIMRLRDINHERLFTGLLKKYGFVEKNVMQEKWWEKLGCPTDDFYLYHYARDTILPS